jgi:hypothetical protein
MTFKATVLDAVPESAYPLSRDALVDLLEGRAVDPAVVALVAAIEDDTFVSVDELEFRLDEALGVPAADPDSPALQGDTGWPTA